MDILEFGLCKVTEEYSRPVSCKLPKINVEQYPSHLDRCMQVNFSWDWVRCWRLNAGQNEAQLLTAMTRCCPSRGGRPKKIHINAGRMHLIVRMSERSYFSHSVCRKRNLRSTGYPTAWHWQSVTGGVEYYVYDGIISRTCKHQASLKEFLCIIYYLDSKYASSPHAVADMKGGQESVLCTVRDKTFRILLVVWSYMHPLSMGDAKQANENYVTHSCAARLMDVFHRVQQGTKGYLRT